MIRSIALFLAGLLIGGAALHFALPRLLGTAEETQEQTAETGENGETPAQTAVILRWRMASNFPSRLTLYGSLGRRFTENVERVSNGTMVIEFAEPGEVVEPERCLEALRAGAVQACWSSPVHWYNRESALAIFAGAPFGPSTREFAAWYYYGGGRPLLDEIYARMGVKSILCGVAAPEGGGWFRREIDSVEDLQGLKMRFFGLGARVLGKLGVITFRIGGNEVVEAMRNGQIDAAEYSMPSVDAPLGFEDVARYYYFPGWHQQTMLLEFVVSRNAWENLPDANRAMIELACGDNFREGLAEGEALQARALRELRARRVELRRFPPEVMAALRRAWREVVEEERDANTTFKRVWDAYAEFRQTYETWQRLGYLTPDETFGPARENGSEN